jgi:5-bromo-4-chloroindolyl phosphate hydrolysis protein
MTLLGKIFTALIIIMSLVFSASAVVVFATHKHWEEAALKAVAERDAARLANVNLEREKQEALNQLAAERAQRRKLISELATKNQQLDEQARTSAADANEFSAQLAIAEKQRDLAIQQKDDLVQENNSLRTSLVAAQKAHDDRLQQVVKLTDDVQKMDGQVKALKDDNKSLAETQVALNQVLKSHGLTVNDVSDEPIVVDGVITKVSATQPLVEISIGEDDGLKPDNHLEVFRGSSYLGRIVIRQTSPNRAVGQVVKELQKQPFQKGDRVATRL